jgi:hypothetical protein
MGKEIVSHHLAGDPKAALGVLNVKLALINGDEPKGASYEIEKKFETNARNAIREFRV